ncbi:hypothetical protein [Sphingomonas sp. KR3-1]|uniref:hypothetical protein n=1 Tax=Sphingomonas sp. KR3-1 TaxID=3156611 RepID=UPI0032B313F5
MIRTVISATTLAAAPFAAQAQTSGSWEVQVEPTECSLVRNQQGAAPGLLAVRTVPGTDEIVVLVSGKDVPSRARDARFPARLTFDDSKPIEIKAAAMGKLASGPAFLLTGFKPDMLDGFAAAHRVNVGTESSSFIAFDVPQARAAIGALRKCVNDLLVDWGADPAQFAPGGTPPVALKPREAWLSRAQLMDVVGTTADEQIDDLFRVTVAADGTIASCKREEAKANAKTEKLGCAPVAGQKLFTPAKNAAGAPVTGAAAFRIRLVQQAKTERGTTR